MLKQTVATHRRGWAFVAAWCVLVAACGPNARPQTVTLDGAVCAVRYHADDSYRWGSAQIACPTQALRFEAVPNDARHLSPCPEPVLLNRDLDRDGRLDLLWITCGWAEVRLSGGGTREAEWKEGRWRYDGAALPGLTGLRPPEGGAGGCALVR